MAEPVRGEWVSEEPPPAPRAVRPGALSTWDMGFGFLWGGGYGGIPAIVLGVLWFATGSPLDDLALDRRGRPTVATVTAVEGTSTEVNDEPLMRVRLRYRDGDDHEQDSSFTTTPPLPQPGDTVQLEYDPETPGVTRPKGRHASLLLEQPWLPLMLVFVFIVPGGLAFGWSAWRWRKRRALYVHGATTQASVERLTESSSTENDVHVMIAHYAFTVDGRRYEGEHKAMKLPAAGDRVWIIYDPADPSQNLLAG